MGCGLSAEQTGKEIKNHLEKALEEAELLSAVLLRCKSRRNRGGLQMKCYALPEKKKRKDLQIIDILLDNT